MAEGGTLAGWLSSFYGDSLALDVFIFAVILAVASLFIWYFYRSIAKRNLIDINLSKYNTYEHPLANKFLAMVLYLLEYMVIMPLLIIFWYAALAFVLFVIASEVSVGGILFVSAVIIGAIRLLAYFHSEIAKDLAKMFPFIALSVFLLSFESIGKVFDFSDVTAKLSQIPQFTAEIFSFILVVFVIEIVLRFIFSVYEFWRSEEEAAGKIPPKEIEEDEE